MINDLSFENEFIKYVDDTTVASISCDPLDDSLQRAADYLLQWCGENGMKINHNKTKEMLLYFGKKFPHSAVPLTKIEGSVIERTNKFKLLGIVFNSTLTWSDHCDYILSEVAKRVYFVSQSNDTYFNEVIQNNIIRYYR